MALVSLLLAMLATGAARAAGKLTAFGSRAGFARFALTNAKWDAKANGLVYSGLAPSSNPGTPDLATIESPEISVAKGFDHLIPSWNATTPPGGYLFVHAQAKVDGVWTKWYKIAIWSRDNRPQPRTHFKDQDDDAARLDTDTLILKKRASAYRLKVELCSVDGAAYPTLRFLSAQVNNSSKTTANIAPVKKIWGTELDVPELSQLSVEGGNVWCSATSTAMVLGYWSRKLKKPEMTVGITEAAQSIFDEAWGGTGNWIFNTAYAGEFAGMRAYVTRFESVSQIEQWIAKGVPVIVSVDYTKLNRRNSDNVTGHLMVIRGFTRTGSAIFNDPWADFSKGQKVRKIFKRADLEYGWLGSNGSHGTVYLIHPEGWKGA